MADRCYRRVIVGVNGVPPLDEFSFFEPDGTPCVLPDNGRCYDEACREALVSLHDKEGKHLGYGCLNNQCVWLLMGKKRFACVDYEKIRLKAEPIAQVVSDEGLSP